MVVHIGQNIAKFLKIQTPTVIVYLIDNVQNLNISWIETCPSHGALKRSIADLPVVVPVKGVKRLPVTPMFLRVKLVTSSDHSSYISMHVQNERQHCKKEKISLVEVNQAIK